MRIQLIAATMILGAVSLHAQRSCNGQTCTFPLNFGDGGAYLTGITGAPFSGQEQDTNSRTLPNGTHLSSEIPRDMTYRDSKGRVRTERHAYGIAPQGLPTNPNDFVIAEIHDPVAGFEYVLDPVNKVAHRMTLPKTNMRKWDPSTISNVQGPGRPGVTTEFLGSKTISGVTAYGEKTVSARPTNAAIVTTNEQWLDPATGIALLLKITVSDSDNVNTRTETNYSEAEPDASLFQVPAGYKTVDETGPFQVVHPQVGGGGSNGLHGPRLSGNCEEGACEVTFDPGNIPANIVLTGAPYSGHQIFTSVVNNGKPFSALPNGREEYRDSYGRLRTPGNSMGGMGMRAGVAPPSFVQIEDPVAGYIYILDPADQTAYRVKAAFRSIEFQPRQDMGQQAGTWTSPRGTIQTTEDLGPQTIFGVTALGIRNTTTYPPGTYNQNDKTVVTVNERWTDPKTGIDILMKNDGIGGKSTNSMPDYKEGDPDPALFQIPAGYKIVDETGKFSFQAPVVSR